MLEVNIHGKKKVENAEKGQIRYNDKGMYVLIVKSESNKFDTIVLNEGNHVEQFDWNSKNANAETIELVYPYVAKGKLEIILE